MDETEAKRTRTVHLEERQEVLGILAVQLRFEVKRMVCGSRLPQTIGRVHGFFFENN